jgi:hypothetical protein
MPLPRGARRHAGKEITDHLDHAVDIIVRSMP